MITEEELSFAYKFPFSKEAKGIVADQSNAGLEEMHKFIGFARARVEEAFLKGRIEYRNIKYGRLDYVIGYAYCRLLVSAIGRRDVLLKYAFAEASRSKEALESGSEREATRVSRSLGLDVSYESGNFKIDLATFLKYMSGREEFRLADFKLHGGFVVIDRHGLSELLKNAVYKEILKGMPIKVNEIPKEVVVAAKNVKIPRLETVMAPRSGSSTSWIEKLLKTPIPDVRHRTVNLVLAPYMVNVRGMSVDDAAKAISEYIELCKGLNADTKINDSYIRYQCAYAKRRGLKPLSFARAKDLLGEMVELG
ncbi:MAG: DNA primase noncatalytic subunit PriX [Candidatus Marsarchaeota archaeon]|jgi:hypothetical protein|nr:DNA primase noncatalytic subunit PriX [Candidatus Marsarchaeota archaeon]MCL5115055.1 DNA primase noncatalytic subunit PriX [Candidatus Marsarchaeota archaeon]